MWVEIVTNDQKVLIGLVYRAPSSTMEYSTALWDEIKRGCARGQKTCIMGDFNMRHINWESLTSSKSEDENFINMILDTFLYQAVNQPTRQGNILDLVLCTSVNLVQNLEVGEKLTRTCDHQIIRFDLECTTSCKSNSIKVPDFRRADFNQLQKSFEKINWEGTLGGLSVNEMYNKFLKIAINLQTKYIPWRELRTKEKKIQGG